MSMNMNMKARILPAPRFYEATGCAEAVLGAPGKADFGIVNETDVGESPVLASADGLLRETLRRLLNVDPDEARGRVTVTLRLDPAAAPDGIPNADQGYCLEIASESVTVTGFGESGLYYGVVTLTQCMALEGGRLSLEACRITDWPDLRTRGHFMESRFGSNLMTLEDWKAVVDHMASL